MGGATSSRRLLRRLLEQDDFPAALKQIRRLPAEQALKHLLASLPASQSELKWRAVTALGQVVRDLAARDLEAAREFVRRLLWALNEESGAVPWGMAEALGEVLASAPVLAPDYAGLLLSYIWPPENFLEFGPLLAGAVWGVGRLASVQPALVIQRGGGERLPPLLSRTEAQVRGMAAWALGWLGQEVALEPLRALASDEAPVELWEGGELRRTTVSELAVLAENKIVDTSTK